MTYARGASSEQAVGCSSLSSCSRPCCCPSGARASCRSPSCRAPSSASIHAPEAVHDLPGLASAPALRSRAGGARGQVLHSPQEASYAADLRCLVPAKCLDVTAQASLVRPALRECSKAHGYSAAAAVQVLSRSESRVRELEATAPSKCPSCHSGTSPCPWSPASPQGTQSLLK